MENRLVQLERLGALAEMSEGISHNLNNILTGILGPAQLMEFHTQEKEVLQEAKIIQAAAMRAADLAKRLSVSVGSEGDTLVPVDVVQAIREAIDSAQPRWKDADRAMWSAILVVLTMKWHQLLIGIKRSLTNGLRFHRCKNDSLWSGWGNGVLWNGHKIAKDRLHGVKLS